MLRLFQIEWIKVKSNRSFWALLLLYILGVYVLCSIGTGLMNMTSSVNGQQTMDLSTMNMYNFPNTWHNLTYIASYLKIFLSITMIVGISNEVQHKTLRQNIIDGMSKVEFIISKVINAFFLATIATLFIVAIGVYFGNTYADNMAWEVVSQRLDFVGAFFLQTFTFLVFSLFIGLLVKSSGLAIVFTIAYSFFIETFFTWIFLDSDGILAAALPMNALDNLIQFPVSLSPTTEVQNTVGLKEILICFIWLVVDIGLSYLALCKKDL
ncbi:ABC transporter permease subunit [Reichenbachiella sp. MALMAid0571]|uniref:ABC transporter permease n=1 Tax=Reichenbachiella sp. MALMAid0571 TaxID=3143939 RepID=UPI0032DE2D46